MKIAVLIACYNRKSKTLNCLDALFKSNLAEGYFLDVFLVDDNSTDGTEQAVREHYPQVNIIRGNGNLYWNGGMRVAFNVAMENGFNYYLWLNDDTLLYPKTIQSLMRTSQNLITKLGKSAIVVGSTIDENSGKLTYGGVFRQCKWKATTFQHVVPSNIPVQCETMNGNCVLIPDDIARVLGNLEPKFAHAMGDIDYGLRAGKKGYSVWVMASFAGTCSRNKVEGSFNDLSLSTFVRLKKMLQPKGLPLASWKIFTHRHTGLLWPIYFILPYINLVIKGILRK